MKSKVNSFKSILVLIVAIAGIVYFYDYVKIIVHSILGFFGLLFALFIFFLLIYSLYSVTKKWLTVGLDNEEKDVAVIILAIIIYGSIFSGLFNLLNSFEDEINSVVFYLIKIVLSSIFLIGIMTLFIEKILNIQNITSKQSLLLIFITLISVIIIEYFYGDKIMGWLENNWYYLLGGFLLISIISFLLVNKKNNPTPK